MDDNERNHIKTFDCHGDQNTLGLRWKRWLTAFELFADGKGLILNEDNANNRQRRRALGTCQKLTGGRGVETEGGLQLFDTAEKGGVMKNGP